MHYDLFNGDGDGIFALHQYRLAYPQTETTLITGVKRDIKLLAQIQDCADSAITVFDVSLDSNRDYLFRVLERNNTISYFDHHFAGSIPEDDLLTTYINPSAETCTSLIVNEVLQNKYASWAIAGAFGDNLNQVATELANSIELSEPETEQLQELGELFNYNGYGSTLDDLHFHPAELYKAVKPFRNPFDFITDSPILATLRLGYKEDLHRAMKQEELEIQGKNRVYRFPQAVWARRVSGVFSNLRARENPEGAHVIITENDDKSLRFSVRAPLNDKRDADTLCKQFPTGGGRAAAAGINSLPPEDLDSFLKQFLLTYP